MDFQTVFNALMALSGAVLLVLHQRQGRHQAELTEFRVKVAEQYVTHAHLAEIRETLIRIEHKLDGKADKHTSAHQ